MGRQLSFPALHSEGLSAIWVVYRVTTPKGRAPVPAVWVYRPFLLDTADLRPGVYHVRAFDRYWTVRVLPDGRVPRPEGPTPPKGVGWRK